jgi:DNA-binding response OmpR family regulator
MNGTMQAHQPHILIIDPRPEELRAIIVGTRQQNWAVTLASTGKRGLHQALSLAFDLILLEARLPDQIGFSVCRLLRESSATRRTPIMFLTAADSVNERIEGLTCGAVDYLTKPCVPEEALARMRIHLQLAAPMPSDDLVPTERLSYEQLVLQAAIRFIRSRMSELPSLDEVARHVGVYDKRLSAIFRRYLGVSVFEWAREEKIRIGRQLLSETGMSVQDIAQVVGFQSACNFTTAFRRHTGCAPNQFRKGKLVGPSAPESR